MYINIELTTFFWFVGSINTVYVTIAFLVSSDAISIGTLELILAATYKNTLHCN